MLPDQKRTLQKSFLEAPERVKELLLGRVFDRVFSDIGSKYRLDTKQRKLAENDATLVLLAFLPRQGMSQRLAEELGVSKDVAEGIFKDLNDKLFALVVDILSEVETELFTFDPADMALDDETPNTNTSPVERMRTMEGDLKRIHGYGSFGELYGTGDDEVHHSSQEELVKKPSLTDLPRYNPNTPNE